MLCCVVLCKSAQKYKTDRKYVNQKKERERENFCYQRQQKFQNTCQLDALLLLLFSGHTEQILFYFVNFMPVFGQRETDRQTEQQAHTQASKQINKQTNRKKLAARGTRRRANNKSFIIIMLKTINTLRESQFAGLILLVSIALCLNVVGPS